jgi:hypothetical protein
MEAYHRDVATRFELPSVVLNIFLQWVIMCCDLMSIEEVLCNESPEVEHTSEVNEKNAPVSTTNYFRLLFLGCPL